MTTNPTQQQGSGGRKMKRKSYAGTYRQYIERIVVRIMQDSISTFELERQMKLEVEGFITDEAWNRIKKEWTNEFLKAVKAKP